MEAPFDDTRIVVPFMPSLFHLAVVKVAFPLYNDFGFETLRVVNKNIEDEASQHENSASSDAGSSGNMAGINSRAKKEFLLVPRHLRKSVLVAIHGFEDLIRRWNVQHCDLHPELSKGNIIFYWRYDGSLDVIKTAEQYVLNRNIIIKKRFEMACSYCLVESIHTLWSQMKESHGVNSFHRCSIARFWIRYMSVVSRLHWTVALVEYVCSFLWLPQNTRMSSCYAFLPLHYKQKYSSFFDRLSWDDKRFCLYAMDKEEQAEMVSSFSNEVLCVFLYWPLQGLFLEMADKMWDFLDVKSFRHMVHFLLYNSPYNKSIDNCELLEGFWNRSPTRLREHEDIGEPLRRAIENCLNLHRSKKKAVTLNEHQKEVI